MVSKGKAGKRRASTGKENAEEAVIDYAANSQQLHTHTLPESSGRLRPSSLAQDIDQSPYQLARDTQKPCRVPERFWHPQRMQHLIVQQRDGFQQLKIPTLHQKRSKQDQPSSPSMLDLRSGTWVDPSVIGAIPHARRHKLLGQYKNIPSPDLILTGQCPDLPFEQVSLPPLIDSASHPRQILGTTPSFGGEEQRGPLDFIIMRDGHIYCEWDDCEWDSAGDFQADHQSKGPTCRSPTRRFFEKFWPGNTMHPEQSDASSDASSDTDISGTEQPWLHAHARPRVVIETSLDTKILCLPCTTLCTSIMRPWNIEGGWSVTRPPKSDYQILIAEHHARSTLGDLRASATAGCALCAFVIWHLERKKDWLPETDDKEKYKIFCYATQKKPMSNCEFTVSLACSQVTFKFYRQLGSDSDFEALEHQELFSVISEDIRHMCNELSQRFAEKFAGYWWPKLETLANPCRDSAEATARVQRLLTKCMYQHDQCYRTRSPLPKRVLDVSGPKIYLYVSNGQEIDTHYLALSYAWGTSPFLNTVKANLKSHCERGISFQSLPNTIKDAVSVTRALRYNYLWVDALCIIQDDSTDWQEQYPRMTEVFRDAVLTISATSSRGVDSGFLRRATENEATLKLGSYHHSEGLGFGDLLVRSTETIRGNSYGQNAVTAAYLNTRGWTFQEHLLSTAVVHYTDHEIIWECHDGFYSETRGYQYPSDIASKRFKEALIGSIDRQRLFPMVLLPKPRNTYVCREEISWAEVFDTWMLWVIRYTPRNLTFPEDRLPAIAGLAKVFSSRFGLTYRAGVWQESLPAGLLWFLVPASGENKSIKSQRNLSAPSWSWASVSGAVGFRGWQATCSVRLPYTQQPLIGDLLVHHVEMNDALGRNQFSNTLHVEGLLQSIVIDVEVVALRGGSTVGTLKFEGAVVEGLMDGIDMRIILDEEQGLTNNPEQNTPCLQPHSKSNTVQCYCLRVCTYWPWSPLKLLISQDRTRTLAEIL